MRSKIAGKRCGSSPRGETSPLFEKHAVRVGVCVDNYHFGNYTVLMHIISLKTLCAYWKNVPETEQSLRAWYKEAASALWACPADIKTMYRSASFLKNNRVVFNICGNKHRLIVRVNYASKTVFIRFIGTHSEYDKINAEDI